MAIINFKPKSAFSNHQIGACLIKNSILETENSHILILRIKPLNFELFSFKQQQVILNLYKQFLISLNDSIQIVIQIRKLNSDYKFKSLKDDQTASLFKDSQIFKREFYLIIAENKADTVSENETINQLKLKADLINKNLSNLGLVSLTLKTEEILHLLKNTYSSPFKTNKDIDLKIKNPQTKDQLLSLISYENLSEGIDFMKLNNCFAQSLSIANYPASMSAGCLSSLILSNLNLDISYHIKPLNNLEVIKKLTRKITELESHKKLQLKAGRLIDENLTNPLESALNLRSKLIKRQESLLGLNLHITIYGQSIFELKKNSNTVKNILQTGLFETSINSYQQILGFEACLPYQQDNFKSSRSLDSSSLALTFPFFNTEIIHNEGILYGVNQSHNSLVIIDRFSLPNANSVTLAQSGAGKSYAMKVEILRQFKHQIQIFILDPENEYKFLVKKLNGQVLDITKTEKIAINFLDAHLNSSLDLNEHISQVIQTLEVMVGELSFEDKSNLDDILIKLYTKNKQPLLEDVYRCLKKNSKLALSLKRYVRGSLSLIFNQPTKFDQNSKLISFNLQNISSDLKPSLMLILTYFISNQIRNNFKKRLLIIDEAWSLIENDYCGQSINNLVRRARKYYLGVCLISQQAEDFLNSKYGQALIAQSSLKILLRQDSSTIDDLTNQFNLSEYEKHFLLTCEVGQALILADRQHATVKITASLSEHPLITTKPKERKNA